MRLEVKQYEVVIEIQNEEFLFNIEARTTAEAHKFAEIEASNRGLELIDARVTVYAGGN